METFKKVTRIGKRRFGYPLYFQDGQREKLEGIAEAQRRKLHDLIVNIVIPNFIEDYERTDREEKG